MSRFAVSALLIAILIAAFALRTFTGRARSRFLTIDLLSIGVFVAGLMVIRFVPVGVPVQTVLTCFILFELTLFFVFLSRSEGATWTAGRAAALTLGVYLLLMPYAAEAPLDGDEPYYLLVSESIVEDFDLDLSNQYAELETSPVGRTDLRPQPDDPVGPRGERFSRYEPFLAAILAPGFALGGVKGALVTIALFAALFARSFVRLLEEEGIGSEAAAAVFAIVVFAPPVINYGTRIWPEVPAAFFFIEAVRGIRQRRDARAVIATAALLLLKLRFAAVAVVLVGYLIARSRRPLRTAVVTMLMLLVPFGVLWLLKGSPLGVHAFWELMPREPWRYARGIFGLLADGGYGVAFQAPFLLLGVLGLSRWREVPAAVRIAVIAAAPYLVLLSVRDEWHGGWSPPLRYIVFLVPFLALSAAKTIDRRAIGTIPVFLLAWTAFLSMHSIAYPWRLFSVATGENFAGRWLSVLQQADFSRLFPSFVRPNFAAFAGAAAFAAVWIAARWLLPRAVSARSPLIPAALAVVFVAAGIAARRPAAVVEFEDAHVARTGGVLDPHEWTIARFRFDGGWRLAAGESASFLFQGGPARLRYLSTEGAEIDLAGERVSLSATGEGWGEVEVTTPRATRVTMHVTSGAATFDRIEVAP
jgi:hypothetical protein